MTKLNFQTIQILQNFQQQKLSSTLRLQNLQTLNKQQPLDNLLNKQEDFINMAIFKIMKQVEDRIPSTHIRPAKECESRRSATLHNGLHLPHTRFTPSQTRQCRPDHKRDKPEKLTCAPLAYSRVTATLPVPLHIQQS